MVYFLFFVSKGQEACRLIPLPQYLHSSLFVCFFFKYLPFIIILHKNKTKKTRNDSIEITISNVIGTKHGIEVENLQGSGKIAGETSAAYDEIFTLSYVTGHSAGIGAYLVRLGQCVIQMQQRPIILISNNENENRTNKKPNKNHFTNEHNNSVKN